MANLVTPETETFAVDLSLASWVEVNYLDPQGSQRRVICDRNHLGQDIRIEMRPHLVVTHEIPDAESEDGYRLETIEMPLERVLLSNVYERQSGPELQRCSSGCEMCSDQDQLLARWVTHFGNLVRLLW